MNQLLLSDLYIGMALALGFIAGRAQGIFGQFQRSAALLHIRRAPVHGLVALAWLSVRVLSSFSPPSSGKQELLLNSFSIELTVQCDGCLIWGLGWRAGLVAGLRVGQAYGGVPLTWVWIVGVSPQFLEHPTSICDTGVKIHFTAELDKIFLLSTKLPKLKIAQLY